MPRPWEYPRWRRVLVQALMWLAFGGTLGLAQLVTYHKQHAVVEMGPPMALGELRVRVPLDWEVLENPGRGRPQLVMADPQTNQRVEVQEFAVPAGATPSISEPRQGRGGSEPIRFAGLKLQGVMQVIQQVHQTEEGLVLSRSLAAYAVRPDGLGVIVKLQIIGTRVGPADRRLLQAIADGITANPARPSAPRHDAPQPERDEEI